MNPIKVINLEALKHNANLIKSYCKTFYAVVKADAYGHGLKDTVETADADGYCVARAEEGLETRMLTEKPVLVMGRVTESEAVMLAKNNVTAAVVDEAQLAEFGRAARVAARPLSVWIKVDSGMHRYGLSPKSAASVSVPNGVRVSGTFSHLATDELERVQKAVASGGSNLSYAATQNLIRLGGTARVGLGLYGYGLEGAQPVMRLLSTVLSVKNVAANEYVGYGSAYRTEKAAKIAVIGIGYADGFRRTVNSGHVLYREQSLPIVGSVCMDVTLVDASGVDIAVGDEVELPAADQLAEELGGIPYEYLTCWTARVERRVTGG